MNSSKLNQLGWAPKVDLMKGLKEAYKEFILQVSLNLNE
jgi:nucleoside-diphosphate-sugar epimerase